MLAVGQKIPNATLWSAPGEAKGAAELVAEGRVLFLFYLFDWSGT